MLKGIDVSGYQNFPFSGKIKTAYNESDFVIVKATQYPNYVHANCNAIIEQCKRDNKLWGFYHYATGQNPEKEAQFFVSKTKGYFGNGIPVVDWEKTQNASFGNTNWVLRFANEVYRLTNVYPMIYVQKSAINQVKNCYPNCSLWVAVWYYNIDNWNYPNFNSDISPWKNFTVWQYTDSNGTLDRNVANISKENWLKIAKGNIKTENNTATKKNIKEIAADVIMGLYGVGKTRKEMITNAGYNYDEVQAYVNELYKVANNVIKGKYGNGNERKTNLNNAGYDYSIIQYIVNDILS